MMSSHYHGNPEEGKGNDNSKRYSYIRAHTNVFVTGSLCFGVIRVIREHFCFLGVR